MDPVVSYILRFLPFLVSVSIISFTLAIRWRDNIIISTAGIRNHAQKSFTCGVTSFVSCQSVPPVVFSCVCTCAMSLEHNSYVKDGKNILVVLSANLFILVVPNIWYIWHEVSETQSGTTNIYIHIYTCSMMYVIFHLIFRGSYWVLNMNSLSPTLNSIEVSYF